MRPHPPHRNPGSAIPLNVDDFDFYLQTDGFCERFFGRIPFQNRFYNFCTSFTALPCTAVTAISAVAEFVFEFR